VQALLQAPQGPPPSPGRSVCRTPSHDANPASRQLPASTPRAHAHAKNDEHAELRLVTVDPHVEFAHDWHVEDDVPVKRFGQLKIV
jgi:hypothetical protein